MTTSKNFPVITLPVKAVNCQKPSEEIPCNYQEHLALAIDYIRKNPPVISSHDRGGKSWIARMLVFKKSKNTRVKDIIIDENV